MKFWHAEYVSRNSLLGTLPDRSNLAVTYKHLKELDQRSQVQVSHLHFLPATNLHLICLERTMSELKPLLLGSMFALLVVSASPAQVTIDVSKITCDQYVLDKVTDFRTITAWLHGFYSGRRNNTVIDVQELERIADKVEEYCRSHRDMALMQAVETTLGETGRLAPRSKPNNRRDEN